MDLSQRSRTKSLNNQKGIRNRKMIRRYQRIFGILFIMIGGLSIISALPQQTPNVLNFGILKINVGTQLDGIRLFIGFVLIYIGYKGVKFQW